MGMVITWRMLSSNKHRGLSKPIIYCSPSASLVEQAIPLNHTLAEMLIQYNPKQRTLQLEKCFQQTIANLPQGAIIKDFDVLFNPEYKVDILKIMVNTCKIKPFGVIWPGILDEDKLIYAEIGYKDYKEYDIKAYDIICVQGGLTR